MKGEPGLMPRPRALPWRRLLPRALEWGLWSAVCLLALVGFVRIVPRLPAAFTGQVDFAAYYFAARLLNHGGELYTPGAAVPPLTQAELGQAVGYLYPPFFAALLRPLASLPYPAAATIWLLFNLLLLTGGAVLLARCLRLSRPATIGLLAAAVLLPASWASLLLGQVNLLIAALLIATLFFSTRPARRPWHDSVAGVCLGLAGAIKVYPLLLVALYVLYRRRRVVEAVIVTGGLTLLIGLAGGGGGGSLRTWLTVVLPGLTGTTAASPVWLRPENQALRGVIGRLFVPSSFQIAMLPGAPPLTVAPPPLVISPLAAATATLLGVVLVLGWTGIWLVRRSRAGATQPAALARAFAVSLVATMLVSPITWEYYFTNLLIPGAALWGAGRRWRIVVGGALLAMLVHRYWRPLLQLVQTPLLLGFGCASMVILWGGLLRMCEEDEC